jgi:hypothetical protein
MEFQERSLASFNLNGKAKRSGRRRKVKKFTPFDASPPVPSWLAGV